MSQAQQGSLPEPTPPATTLILTAALTHYFDRSHGETGSSRSDAILRIAIAGELTARR